MFIDERHNKNGTVTYRITYYGDDGKRKRLPAKEYPKFKTRGEAEQWIKNQAAYQAVTKALREKKLAWRSQYSKFEELEQGFYSWHAERAVNSGHSDSLYMSYVFEYFLQTAKVGNVNLWKDYNQRFKDWLKQAAGTKKSSAKLSYSTINHCIRALNNFTEYCALYGHLEPELRVPCKPFPQELVGKRGYKDVIPPDEFAQVHKKLKTTSPDVADFFYLSYHLGTRFHETYSLVMEFVHQGKLTGPLGEELEAKGFTTYGYLLLKGQIKTKARHRRKDRSFDWKPLKTRKTMEPKDWRTVPVTDKEAWNIIARRYKAQKQILDKQVYGTDKWNYLLFDNLTGTTLNTLLREAYISLGKRPKTYHCCRHSKATYLVGQTRSYFISRAMLGHKSDAYEDYVHIYEMMALEAGQSSLDDIDEVI